MEDKPGSKFEQAAAEDRSGNIVTEFWQFIRENKKWWLLPVAVLLLAFGVLVFLAKTGAAPFIYTLF